MIENIHLRVEEHENSISHRRSSEALMLQQKNLDVQNLVNKNLNTQRRREILDNRKIVTCVINVIKLIANFISIYTLLYTSVSY